MEFLLREALHNRKWKTLREKKKENLSRAHGLGHLQIYNVRMGLDSRNGHHFDVSFKSSLHPKQEQNERERKELNHSYLILARRVVTRTISRHADNRSRGSGKRCPFQTASILASRWTLIRACHPARPFNVTKESRGVYFRCWMNTEKRAKIFFRDHTMQFLPIAVLGGRRRDN